MKTLFKADRTAVIGMIHVGALPGTPHSRQSPELLLEQASREAESYREAGIDAIIVENMHDRPYLNTSVGPEIVACMTTICREVQKVAQVPCGVQVLAGANREALAVAQAAGLAFIRAEGFVFGHLADEGMMNSCAGDLLRYRKNIGAETIQIWADIKKKHSAHAITADISIADTAVAAEYCLADGVIVTGSHTGEEASRNELGEVKSATSLPVLIGSGITDVNCRDYLKNADGLIVGSWFKENGDWTRPVDGERVKRLMEIVSATSRA